MYNHFVCQLSDTRLMDANKKYIKQLDGIDKQHNFLILPTLYGGNYDSMILENLQHIYESLCFATETMASKPYKERMPIDFTKKKIKSCQDCGGWFSLKDGSAELTCINCGRIEILHGTAFAMRKTYNVKRTTRKYTFKYRLNKLLDSCYYPTRLSHYQINEANCIFEHIQDKLPKKICYPLVIYKILEKIITDRPQLMILKYIETKIPASTYLEHEQRWNYAFRNSETSLKKLPKTLCHLLYFLL